MDRFERRRRAVSRIALYGTVTLAAVIGLALAQLVARPTDRGPQQWWQGIDFESMEEVQLLGDYVRIDTTHATGNVLEGARFLERHLREAGLDPELEILSERDANLWAIVEGRDPRAIVLHNHIDVEDIHDPERWSHPPFGGVVRTPWMYGRGTFDMKSVAIAQMLAIIDLAQSGETPERSVIFLATTGEETGSFLGTQWVLRQHPELVERFDVVLTEGGVLEGRSGEDLKYWATEFAQKRYVDVTVCAPSRERLEALGRDVQDWGRPDGPLLLPEETRRFLPVYAETRDRDSLAEAMADPELALRQRSVFEALPAYVQAMYRPELYAAPVREAEGGGGWELPMKIHLLPGQGLDDVREQFLDSWLLHGLTLEVYEEPAADHGSPLDHPVLDAIAAEIEETYPGTPTGPIFLPWTATDSRFFRAAGIPSYGFTPFVILTTDALQVGGSAERIALPGYHLGVEMYRRLVGRLASMPSPEDGGNRRVGSSSDGG